MLPEPHALPTDRPAHWAARWGLTASCLCAAWLAGCATAPTPPNAAPVTAAHAVEAAEPATAQPEPLATESDEPTTAAKDLLRDTLAYADRTLGASTTDLARETARLSDLDESKPSRALRLALVLAQTRQPADTARALGLVQRTLANPAAQDLHPLARLLEARLTQQRRLEDQLDRQAQQLREAQRRNDQLSERLEAVRAIERSLTTRPATAPATSPPGAAASGVGSSNGNGNAKP
ncbi:hypothetical protein CLU85_0983 [Acidovorax sp. 69]|uniref:hypothetical protein n=1 Tax=Acidovorax sp. 69 TaxID=2035202 RepID=UPI000CB6AF6B|nr:hypothetical protein [Acidovorax sp. 69]PJI96242.1 hypothetical protein CLU85_0983 [Acidovorax sp. 69]